MYNLPDDTKFRKADRELRAAVRDSEAIRRLERLANNSIHPANIFFQKDMSEE